MYRRKMDFDSVTRTRLFVGLETAENHAAIAPEEVIEFIRECVGAGTFYEGKGLWKGKLENSIVFESMMLSSQFRDDVDVDSVEELKSLLEDEFCQDSVMVERQEVEAAF